MHWRGARATSEEDSPELQALMTDSEVPTSNLRERPGVSKATLHRYVGPI